MVTAFAGVALLEVSCARRTSLLALSDAPMQFTCSSMELTVSICSKYFSGPSSTSYFQRWSVRFHNHVMILTHAPATIHALHQTSCFLMAKCLS